jgi:tellurite resistance protein
MTMIERSDLAPLFTDLPLSADDANAIVAALHDVAQSDGVHENEREMIRGFVEMLHADLGEAPPAGIPAMTPAKLASLITSAPVRKLAVQSAVLLAWADGVFSDVEKARIAEYATALGFSQPEYAAIEKTITGWVQSGDAGLLF